MKIVSLEWFEQSLERGMVLDEALYNPTLPLEERGKDAWIRLENPSPALGKRMRDAEQSQPLNPNRRKLRRAASTKLGSQGDALWAEIVTPGLDQGQTEQDDWTEGNLFKHITPQVDVPAVLGQNDAAHGVETEATRLPLPAQAHPHDFPELEHGEGIFQGCIVITHGFDQNKVCCDRLGALCEADISPRLESYMSIWKRMAHGYTTSTTLTIYPQNSSSVDIS